MPCYLRKATLGIVFARVGSNPAGDVSFAILAAELTMRFFGTAAKLFFVHREDLF